jgi:FAD synthetase
MTRVLATGVFNIIHPGHILFLEEAKKLGDELVVIVSSDKVAKQLKKGLILPQEQRAKVVGALKAVDKVFVGDESDTLKLLPIIRPDVIALGHDQKVDEGWLQDRLATMSLGSRVIRIKARLGGDFLSSSAIADRLKKN